MVAGIGINGQVSLTTEIGHLTDAQLYDRIRKMEEELAALRLFKARAQALCGAYALRLMEQRGWRT